LNKFSKKKRGCCEEGDHHQWWRRMYKVRCGAQGPQTGFLVKSGIEVAHQNGDKFGFGLEEKGLEFVPKM
jgi:hypothetical protein